MGLFGTRWEASYQGHNVTVLRNEMTRGFSIEWDGREIARRSWSMVGLGELHGSAEIDGKDVDVKVVLDVGGPMLGAGVCRISVDGANVEGVEQKK
jgi:hypothetical protein